MSLRFIETDRGWISDRFVVRIFRGTEPDTFRIVYFDGQGTETAIANEAAVADYLHQSGQDRPV